MCSLKDLKILFKEFVMKTITMERVKKLDRIWVKECSECLQMAKSYRGPSPFFIQEKYLDGVDLKKIAMKWRVSIEELQTYITLQRYVNSAANNDCQDLPQPEDAAREFGISLTEFNDYLHEEVKKIHDSRAEDEDDITGWRDVTAEDFGDIEDDILQDAAIEGE